MNTSTLSIIMSALFSGIVLSPGIALAANHSCYSTITIYANDGSGSANLISLDNTSCEGACTSLRKMYVEFSEKQLWAAAMTAAFNHIPVYVAWDDAATSKGITYHENVACKLFRVDGKNEGVTGTAGK